MFANCRELQTFALRSASNDEIKKTYSLLNRNGYKKVLSVQLIKTVV